MNWAPAIATAVIQAIGVIYMYGQLTRSNTEHERRLDKNDIDHKDILKTVEHHTEAIGKIKGRLGINGMEGR